MTLNAIVKLCFSSFNVSYTIDFLYYAYTYGLDIEPVYEYICIVV